MSPIIILEIFSDVRVFKNISITCALIWVCSTDALALPRKYSQIVGKRSNSSMPINGWWRTYRSITWINTKIAMPNNVINNKTPCIL